MGSGWKNPDLWSTRNKPIRFKDLGFQTTEMLQKKLKSLGAIIFPIGYCIYLTQKANKILAIM